MDVGNDAASLPSCVPRTAGGGGRARRSRAGAAAVQGEQQSAAMLALRDECTHARQRELAAEEKMRHLAAQLARTGEAAKRILTRTDPTARGGVAQRLLDAEQELARVQAELAELGSQLARAKRQAADRKSQAAELKARLNTALASQRTLALQLARLQAGGGARGGVGAGAGAGTGRGALQAASRNAVQAAPGEAEPVTGDGEVDAEATFARQFAAQQEQLAAAQERSGQLEVQLRQQQRVLEAQARELTALKAQLACSGGSMAGTSAVVLPAAHRRPASAGGPAAGGDGGSCWRCASPDSIDGSQGGAAATLRPSSGGDAAWLRLKYLESRTALERSTASNTRLLHELEDTRTQLRQLQRELLMREQQEQEQAKEWERQQLELGEQQQEQWDSRMQERASSQSSSQWEWGDPADGTARYPSSSCRRDAVHPLGVAAEAMLELKQQLAAANHRAARLQIELDAAVAKLAVLETCSNSSHRGLEQQPAQQLTQQPHRPKLQPLQPVQPLQLKQGNQQQMHGPPAVVELHLHAAEVDQSSLPGALGYTFLTADVQGFSTAMTPVAAGQAPVFNTTLQFTMNGEVFSSSLADLAATEARVELHRCTSSSTGSADYVTVAAASVPLSGLLGQGAASSAASQRQQCTLFSKNGAAVGSLWFGLSIRSTPGSHFFC